MQGSRVQSLVGELKDPTCYMVGSKGEKWECYGFATISTMPIVYSTLPFYSSWTSLLFDVVITSPLPLGSLDNWLPAYWFLLPFLTSSLVLSPAHLGFSSCPRSLGDADSSSLWALSPLPAARGIFSLHSCQHHSGISQIPQKDSQAWVPDFHPHALPTPSVPFCSKWPKTWRHLWLLFSQTHIQYTSKSCWLFPENKFRTWLLVTISTTTWFSLVTNCLMWPPN